MPSSVVLCALKHRMIPIVEGLMLCECSSYGRLASRKGAVEAARRMVDKAGGIDTMRNKIEIAEASKDRARAKKRKEDLAKVQTYITRDVPAG
jgi:hypothetical protein